MGIRGKLISPFIAGYLIIVAIIQLVWQPLYIAEELESFEKTQRTALVSIEPTLTENILAGDIATVYAHMEQHLSIHQNEWLNLVVVDKNNQRIYPLIEKKMPATSARLIYISHELWHLDEYLGKITLTADNTQDLQSELGHIANIEYMILAVFAAIYFFSFIWQNHLINKPLLQLKNAALRLTEGDFQTSIEIPNDDEIGELSKSLENMRLQIRQQHHELQEAASLAQLQEIRQRAVINTMSDGVITSDNKGMIESFNPAAERIFGYDAAEVLGQKINMLMPETIASHHSQYMQNYMKKKSGTSAVINHMREVRAQHKKGHPIEIEVTVSEIYTEGEHLFSAIMRDITESKAAQEELRIAATAFNTHEGLIIADKDANIIKVNPAFKEITGYNEEEVIGQNPKLLSSGRHNTEFYRELWGDLLSKGYWAGEIWNKRKSGEIYPEWLAITAVKNEHNETTHYVGNFLDISEQKTQQLQLKEKASELKKAKEAAEQASIAKSDFLANMSHEIRTPMNGVLGMTQLLADTDLNTEQKEYVETIQNSGQMLLNIINDILDFSKIEANKMSLEPITFNLEKTAFNAMQMFNTRKKTLELLFNYAPDCPTHVIGDAGRIRQVITNLISNAIKFTSEGHVFLNVKCQQMLDGQAHLLFEIQDTGIGIKPEVQETLFQEFTQADTSTTRKYGGTGLGLAICKKIINLMNGEIGIKSAPGEGSTFWFKITLPFAERPEPIPKATVKNLRTLIVDDNSVNRRILTEQLDKFGLITESVDCGEKALQRLREQHAAGEPFQLALLDYMMPDMNGEELGIAIYSDPDLTGLPLILLTSAGQRGDAQHFKNIGFTAYLTKPVTSEILFHTLEAVSGLHQQNINHELITQYNYHENVDISNARPQFVGKILLVEDDLTNQKVAISTLNQFGLEPDVANNGIEALDLFHNTDYDLILMDCQMPEMDGYEATRQIRELEIDRHVPIIAMTANIQPSDQKKCHQAGMNDFLAKPFQISDLASILSQWLQASASSDTPSAFAKEDFSQAGIVNQETLNSLQETIGSAFEELLRVFTSDLETKVHGMNEALANRNFSDLRMLSHSLKSSSASLGAVKLAKLSENLENMSKDEIDSGLDESLTQVIEACKQVKSYMQSLMQDMASK